MGRVVGLVVAVATCVAGARVARAQEFPDNPLIQQGIDLYNDLEYEASIEALQRALVRAENIPQQKVAIFKYLALDYLVLGRTDDAPQAFRQLLAIEPEFALDPAVFSPDHRQFLEGVRAQWIAEGRPGYVPPEQRLRPAEIDHELPAQATRGESLEVFVTVLDPDVRVRNVVLAYRPQGETAFVRLDAAPSGGGFRATIPGDAVAPPVIEYYFEALDAAGNVAGRRGDARVPLRVPVPGEEEGGILTKWWFWTAIGVGVAASIAIPVALTVGGEETPGGPASVTVVFCDPSVPGDCPR
jgi:tetratricopeptide (TPR) repeat protein